MRASEALPRILPAAIVQMAGSRAAARGEEYARTGRVLGVEWDPSSRILSGHSEGSAPEPYLTVLTLAEYDEEAVSRRFLPAAAGGLWRPLHSRCDCPVGGDCKHSAAVLYRVNALIEESSTEEPPAEWRTVLRPLLTSQGREQAPQSLAISFDLEATPLDAGRRYGREPATPAHVEAGHELRLGIRPLKRGRKGTWIKGGLSWRTFEYRASGREYHPDHAEALTRIFAAAHAERSYVSGAVEQLWLSAVGSPMLWQALAFAREVGVELVPGTSLSAISLHGTAQLELDLRRDRTAEAEAGAGAEEDIEVTDHADALTLTPRVLIDAEEATPVRALGSAGVIAPGEWGPDGFTARIAPVDRPLPTTIQRLLNRAEPLRVPAADQEDFLTGAYPQLRMMTPVTSSDDSVVLPAPVPPTLLLQASFSAPDTLTLRWSWQYHAPDRSLPIDPAHGPDREVEHEQEVLEAAREVWSDAGSDLPQTLRGSDTAWFSEHILDRLGALEHVEVEIHGARPDFQELGGAPRLRVTQRESAGKHDWFDLGFEVTIGETVIPFPTLFVALAEGRKRLLLPDRTHFSLEDPVFDTLRDLIRDGEALAEWDPEHQAISRFQVDIWDDLEEIAEEAVASARWQRTVGGLRDLTSIDAPPLPAGLQAELRPYQLEGFTWLTFLHTHGLGGVLADDMGLGKTLQTLALIAHAREQDPQAPPFLVVAPASVLPVWRREAERFTPGLDVRVLDRTGRARGTALPVAIRDADVVVTSYTVLRIDEEEYAEPAFQGLVLDEAQFVKNRRARTHRAARRVQAGFRLAITGTPMENSLDDLWSILAIAAPGLLGGAPAFRQRFTQPIETGEHPERMELLRSRVRPFVLRRTKELVAKELPEKHEEILTVTLGPRHRALYDSLLQRERKKILGLIESDLDRQRFTVFRSLTLLRMMALDPRIVDEQQHADVPSSKLEALFDRLEEVLDGGHRVLLFSQFTSYLGRVAEELEARGVRYSYLDGSTRDRDAAVSGFRDGDAPVFLISLKAGGFGLTLTEADYVFLLDPWWNPAAENQAVDRAHRIGQERTVMVYRMVAEDTIEEKVLALQRRKAELFDALTDGGEAFRSAISAEDIRELIS
jgi:hypothetical protein